MLLSYTCCTFLVTACLCLHSLLAPAQTLLKDIFSGPAGSTPTSYTTLNGILYFIADDGTHGRELWKSDGTAGGTQLVKDINPGPKSSDIREMTVCNGLLFFSAFSKDGIFSTRQVWRSDGTAAGTFSPYDGHKDGEVQGPINLTKVGNILFFVTKGSLGGTDQWLLSRSDGTDSKSNQPVGTGSFHTFNFSVGTTGARPPANFTNVHNTLYFTYEDNLYKVSGAPDDPNSQIVKIMAVPNANRLVSYQNSLFFVAGQNKSEIWSSGSTAATTTKWATTGTDSIVNLTRAGNYLYFVAGTTQRTVWVGSGKLPPLKLATFPVAVRQITNLATPLSLDPVKTPSTDQTYFVAGNEVYQITSKTWTLTKLPGSYGNIEALIPAKQRVYFLDAKGLRQIDTSGKVSTLFTTPFFTRGLTNVTDRLYFTHYEQSHGLEPGYFIIPL